MEDKEQLVRLVNSAYRGEEARQGWTHEADLIEGELRTDESDLQELLSNPNSTILKANLDGQLAGCVYLERQDHVLYLGMLSVSPRLQSHGIGKALLAAADDHARKHSCHSIHMTVISARPELIQWYERNGYRKTAETKPFQVEERFGRPRQPVEFSVMEKKL